MKTFQIRPAAPDDAFCLSVLATQVFLEAYAYKGIYPVIARHVQTTYSLAAMQDLLRTQTVLLLCDGDALQGFAQLSPLQQQDGGQRCELERLYFLRCFTGQGLGAALLQASEECARAMGADLIWLRAWAGNHGALRFYARHGWQDVGQTWFEMEDGRHENRVMQKVLCATLKASE
ncbi:GNAT family N-acetyltransferase [Massilia sp. W12]|uniref:GNAT family N-acetyltransferase n=1 Tax=Massilia sp. W12 TaxID=3126507 RepID=UPI0030D0CEEC